jgi:3',5'-cyclic AMP phosphodiesterase CpdA
MSASETVQTLAHLSDVHLPLVGFTPRTWRFKRLTGYINWQRKRRHVHRPETSEGLLADLSKRRPDHVAVTGDLVNLGLPAELEQARRWLERVGPPDHVSVVPGNHDIYVPFGHDPGLARWQAYMRSDAGPPGPCEGRPASTPDLAMGTFPYLRIRGRLALIGLCSAAPMPPFIAAGRAGEAQLTRLRQLLDETRRDGFVRVVMIHHPPIPGLASASKALRDADALGRVLAEHGAELVLHGHMHSATLVWWPSQHGSVPILGVPSASVTVQHDHEPLARYHWLRFTHTPSGPRIELEARGLCKPGGPVREITRFLLAPGTSYPPTVPLSEPTDAAEMSAQAVVSGKS